MSDEKVVLVIEDDLALIPAIRVKLEENKLIPLIAQNADEAMKIIEEERDIAVFWIDHYLPGDETGLDVLGKLRKHAKYHNTPVIIVTNYDDYSNMISFLQKTGNKEDQETYQKYKVDKYFIKSNTSLDQIVQEVKELAG